MVPREGMKLSEFKNRSMEKQFFLEVKTTIPCFQLHTAFRLPAMLYTTYDTLYFNLLDFSNPTSTTLDSNFLNCLLLSLYNVIKLIILTKHLSSDYNVITIERV